MSNPDDLSAQIALCPQDLRNTIEEFRSVPARERLEYLLEYSDDLPDLPENLQADRDSMERVHECQSPVFLHTELNADRVRFYFDVPPESPTVRGYAAILQQGFQGTPPSEVLAAPDDIYILLGLQEAISPLRLRGLHALMVYMKRQVQHLL